MIQFTVTAKKWQRRLIVARHSPPCVTMKLMISSTPSPSLRLVKTKGRKPRMRRASRSMTSRLAPTSGARSILLMTSRSERVIPGAAFARDLVAGGDVNDIDRQIGEFGREGRGEVVAPRLDQYQVETRKYSVHLGDGGEIDRGVLADRRVRTAPGLDAADPLRRQRSTAGQEFGVLAGIDDVRDGGDLVAAPHLFAQPIHQRGFARADWAANPETQWTAHDRKSLVYCVSCAIDASSTAKVALPKQSGSRVNAAADAEPIAGSSAARMR